MSANRRSYKPFPPHPLSCPHGKDKTHGGLGKAWCDAGIEGAKRQATKGSER